MNTERYLYPSIIGASCNSSPTRENRSIHFDSILILARCPSRLNTSSYEWKDKLIRAVPAATLSLGPMLEAQASTGNQGLVCVAKVLKSEELPYAPMGYWRVRVTLEITPRGGPVFETTLQDNMPWSGPAPRKGQAFRLRCDPVNPGNLRHL
jgi:hypothetical protein